MRKQKHIALLLAGGKGSRMQQHEPKQFSIIGNKPLIAYTMQAFEQHPDIDCIYVVCDSYWEHCVKQAAKDNSVLKFRGCFPSGGTSMESLRNGIHGLANLQYNRADFVLTHDAVRPLISAQVITDNLSVCHQMGNAISGIQSNEAYMVSTDGIHSQGFIERESLFRAQTPQSFSLGELIDTFRDIPEKELQETQSLYTLMAARKKQLYIAAGNNLNFKVTIPGDIEIVKAIINWQNNPDKIPQ